MMFERRRVFSCQEGSGGMPSSSDPGSSRAPDTSGIDLQKLAEGIKRRFGVTVIVNTDHYVPNLEFQFQGFSWYLNEGDQKNSGLIVWGLDRLEELGLRGSLYPWADHYVISFNHEDSSLEFSGETRAEAVAHALVLALSAADQNGGDLPLLPIKELKDGEPCNHRGCLSHVYHPCEGCGRIAGKSNPLPDNKQTSSTSLSDRGGE